MRIAPRCAPQHTIARGGNAVLVSSWREIWRYPLRGEPQQLVRIHDLVWHFEPTQADTLYVARIPVNRDAVLITGFR